MAQQCNTLLQEKLLECAKRYALLGLRVIPLKGKVPSCAHGLSAASCDLDQIEQWFGPNTKNTGIGIATGSMFADSGRFIVLDCDCQESDLWLQTHLPECNTTWCVRTGSGGMHYYLGCSTELRNSTHILKRIPSACHGDKSCDVRGEGGYVVAPPSLHPNGNTYTWVRGPIDDNTLPFMESLPLHYQDGRASGELFSDFEPATQTCLPSQPQTPIVIESRCDAQQDYKWERRKAYVNDTIPKICSDIACAGSGTPRHNTTLSKVCKVERWLAEPRLELDADAIEAMLLQAMQVSKPECTAKDRAEYAQIMSYARKGAIALDESEWDDMVKASGNASLEHALTMVQWPEQPQTVAASDDIHTDEKSEQTEHEQYFDRLPDPIKAFIDRCDPNHARGSAALGLACVILGLTGCCVYSRDKSLLAAPTRVQEHHFLAEPSMGKTYLTSLIKRIAKDMDMPDQPIAVIDALANSREALEDLIGYALCERTETDGKVEWVPKNPLPHVLILWDEFAAQTADQVRSHDVYVARRQAFVNSLQSGEFQPSRSRTNSKGPQWPSISGINVMLVSMDQIGNGRTVLSDSSAEGASRRRALWTIECHLDVSNDTPPERVSWLRAQAMRASFRESDVIAAARDLRSHCTRVSCIDLPPLCESDYFAVYRITEWASDSYLPYLPPEGGGGNLGALKLDYMALLCAKAMGAHSVSVESYSHASAIVRAIAQTERTLLTGLGAQTQADSEFEAMFAAAAPDRRQQAYEPWRFLARIPANPRDLAAFRDFALRRLCLRSTGKHKQFDLLRGGEIEERGERVENPVYQGLIEAVQTHSRAALSRTLRRALEALAMEPVAQQTES